MSREVQRRKKSKVSMLTNKAHNKAVLLFGFDDFCLMYVVKNHRLLTS